VLWGSHCKRCTKVNKNGIRGELEGHKVRQCGILVDDGPFQPCLEWPVETLIAIKKGGRTILVPRLGFWYENIDNALGQGVQEQFAVDEFLLGQVVGQPMDQ